MNHERDYLRERHDKQIKKICSVHGISENRLWSRSRRTEAVRARRDLAKYLRAQGFSYPLIGLIMAKNHTSIMNLCGALPYKKQYSRDYYNKYFKSVELS